MRELAVFDAGAGPGLFVGGFFTSAGGVAANHVARWDGSVWSALGSGLGGSGDAVDALHEYDDGGGPALFAGGSFAGKLARWDGSAWSALGGGLQGGGDVNALTSWDDGDAFALYAGGGFTVSPAGDSFLAKWGCRTKPTVKKRKL